MKAKFSTKWKASKQPRKQRKYIHNAPIHVRRKFLASTLDKEIRKKYGMRNIEVKKGDEVKIMRGKFRGKSGKVSEVYLKTSKIAVEGINRAKRDGTKVNVLFHASKVKITSLNLEDSKRFKKKEVKVEKAETKSENKSGGKVKVN